jgi:thymidylate synthase
MVDIKRNTVADIRDTFVRKYQSEEFCANGTIEVTAASFIADEDSIFGVPNLTYIKKELAWYHSNNLNIDGLEPEIPKIWRQVASKKGLINSNYGWCIYSKENNNQFAQSIVQLVKDPHSRQAVMIYTRPTMHQDAIKDSMNDFMCTNTVQLLLRDNKLEYHVNMRSNDVVFGYNNDYAWHKNVYDKCIEVLSKFYTLDRGNIFWHAGSLHVYPRHFHLIEEAS